MKRDEKMNRAGKARTTLCAALGVAGSLLTAAIGVASAASLPFELTVSPVTNIVLPEYLDPVNHQPPPSGMASDFPIPAVAMDGEFWMIFKNGYSPKVIRYKGTTIENAVRQPDGKLNLSNSTWGTVMSPYLLGGMWYDASEKKLYAPLHCEYHSQYGGGDTYGTKLNRQIHLAVSEDKGATWNYVGPIITRDAPSTPRPESGYSGRYWHGGDGDFTLYADEKDGYVYVYSNHYLWLKPGNRGPRMWGIRVARCAMSDKMAPGKWKRFYNGSFSEPGLGGKASFVEGATIYNSFLGKYISFAAGSSIALCTDLSKQDWTPKFYMPGDYWICNGCWGLSVANADKNAIFTCDSVLYLYRYWHTAPGAAFKLTFNKGATPDAAGYVASGLDDLLNNPNGNLFPRVMNPTRPYPEPLYDHDDPIVSRRVRKVSCLSPEVTYAGKWVSQNIPVLAKISGRANDRLTFKFKGSGIFWRAASGPDGGKADVYLDGKLEKTVDFFGDYTPYLFWYIKTGLDATRTHTVKIVARGDKNAKSAGTMIRHLSFEYAAEVNQASDGFSGIMGKNDWHYESREGSVSEGLGFNVLANCWQKEGLASVGPDFLLPAGNKAAVRRWVAPHDGRVRVEGVVSVDADGGAGAVVRVLHNSAAAWSARLVQPGRPATHDFKLAVAKGDSLSFIAGTNGVPARQNRINWDPAITFVSN